MKLRGRVSCLAKVILRKCNINLQLWSILSLQWRRAVMLGHFISLEICDGFNLGKVIIQSSWFVCKIKPLEVPNCFLLIIIHKSVVASCLSGPLSQTALATATLIIDSTIKTFAIVSNSTYLTNYCIIIFFLNSQIVGHYGNVCHGLKIFSKCHQVFKPF